MAVRITELVAALTGRFKNHHAFMARLHLNQIDAQSRIIDALTSRIEEAMEPFRAAREFLATIQESRSKSPTSSSPKPERT